MIDFISTFNEIIVHAKYVTSCPSNTDILNHKLKKPFLEKYRKQIRDFKRKKEESNFMRKNLNRI